MTAQFIGKNNLGDPLTSKLSVASEASEDNGAVAVSLFRLCFIVKMLRIGALSMFGGVEIVLMFNF